MAIKKVQTHAQLVSSMKELLGKFSNTFKDSLRYQKQAAFAKTHSEEQNYWSDPVGFNQVLRVLYNKTFEVDTGKYSTNKNIVQQYNDLAKLIRQKANALHANAVASHCRDLRIGNTMKEK